MNGQDDSLGGSSARMVDKIRNAGFYNANNKFLIDIADSACWANTDTITDLSSVGGYPFINGWSGTPGTADMVSVGTLGSLSKNTYLESNSTGTGQSGTQDAVETVGPDQSWIINLHKNNGLGSLAGWFWQQNAGSSMTFFATSEIFWTNDQGFAVAQSGGPLGFWNRTGGAQGQILGGASVPTGSWVFIACGIDEANNDVYIQVNATQNVKADYASTDTGAPDGKLHLGVNSVSHWSNGLGWRLNCAFGWDDYMTPTEMMAVYDATKDRFL